MNTVNTAASNPLPPLRQTLQIHPGPLQRDGTPSWTLEDPARNRFYRLGPLEFELLCHWHLGSREAVLGALGRDNAIGATPHEVDTFARFLSQHELTLGNTEHEREQLLSRSQQSRPNPLKWLAHNYLFMRIPLLRPDPLLTRSLPWVEPLFSRTFWILTLIVALLGLVLAAQQWQQFIHTLLHFFTLEGAAVAGLILVLTKCAHELGHAYSCKRYGGHVAHMGIAFLVLWPVLYTDTTSAWRLPSQRARLTIGAAGMLVELAIAAWATLAWNFLPDGILRSAAFMLATTTWILTLAVNLSPFMRFDGYFLLSDLLEVPNLQSRAFAHTRWRLRRWLFGVDEAPPEPLQPGLARTLTLYSFATWIYRVILFTGIALLVYHLTFKLLGILLFTLEIYVFLARPILNELAHWYRRRNELRMNRNTLTLALIILTLALLAALPWRTSVQAPALAQSARQHSFYVPSDARLHYQLPEGNNEVNTGDRVFTLSSAALNTEIEQTALEIETLNWRLQFQTFNTETAADLPVVRQHISAALPRLARLQAQKQALSLNAPFDGVLIDREWPLSQGEPLAAGTWLGTLIDPDQARVEAYVSEADLARLSTGASAQFYPQALSEAPWELEVSTIEHTPTRSLARVPELTSLQGGELAAKATTEGEPMAQQALYRVVLTPTGAQKAPLQSAPGRIVIDGEARSPIARFWRSALAVLLRETSF